MRSLACALALAASAPASVSASPPTSLGMPDKPAAFEATLKAGDIHEECMKVEGGKTRRYEWTSDVRVDFNIHFHRGKDVHYPVTRDGAKKESGNFTAPSTEEYCWMWTAKEAAKIRGTFR